MEDRMPEPSVVNVHCSYPDSLAGFFYGAQLQLQILVPDSEVHVYGAPSSRVGVEIIVAGLSTVRNELHRSHALEDAAHIVCENFGLGIWVKVLDDERRIMPVCLNMPDDALVH
jgi:hypothetical protein